MIPITFKPYGVNQAAPTVIAERISHWYQIDYNGNYGTEIVLDTGVTIRVGEWTNQVEEALLKALASPTVPEIDYDALIKAAEAKHKTWRQGSPGCVAFAKGAEWFRGVALTAVGKS